MAKTPKTPKTAKTAQTSAKAGARPDADVIDLLLEQHARIEVLFTLVASSSGQARTEAFDELARLLAVHETGEEEVVHPIARGLRDVGGIVDERLREEQDAKQMLVDLVGSGPDTPGFNAALAMLREAVLTHARYEERYEFPQLRQHVPAAQLVGMATTLRAAEKVAPTRPHPSAQSAAANLTAGPPLAVIDRVRDAIRDATRSG